MKVVIAPDKFKGSLTAMKAARAMGKGVLAAEPKAEICLLPAADGGDGTAETVLAAGGGSRIHVNVTGPLGQPVDSYFVYVPETQTAVIEMALASGMTLVPAGKGNPLVATTYGTGELICSALDKGCRRIVVGIGGSATNDGGVGMAQALGFRFLDAEGYELSFGGRALCDLQTIDISKCDTRLADTEMIAVCDVTAVLCGEKGASSLFGPQKGATPEAVTLLDTGLRRLAIKIEETFGISVLDLPGGGAGGGLGAGLHAFAGARIEPGAKWILDLCGFNHILQNADLVITGEGRTDSQTAMGKMPAAVAQRAKQYGIPVICISGQLGEGYRDVYSCGIDAAFSMVPRPATLQEAFEFGETWIEQTTEAAVRLFRAAAFHK